MPPSDHVAMPYTGPSREEVLAMLRHRFSAIKLEVLPVDRIALFRQDDGSARFRIIDHWQLRDQAV